MNNSETTDLLALLDQRIAEAKAEERFNALGREKSEPKSKTKPKPKPATRAAINKANAQKSTGPKSHAGKAASATNSLKHGFFANIARLDPTDAPTFQNLLTDFRESMKPDGPIEDLCCRELAMLQARLQRLESIEFAMLMGNVETKPATPKSMYQRDEFNDNAPLDYAFDPRALAQSFLKSTDALDRLHKIETHLRRFYNRTFDRLQKSPLDPFRPPSPTPPSRSLRRRSRRFLRTNPIQPNPSGTKAFPSRLTGRAQAHHSPAALRPCTPRPHPPTPALFGRLKPPCLAPTPRMLALK